MNSGSDVQHIGAVLMFVFFVKIHLNFLVIHQFFSKFTNYISFQNLFSRIFP